jgi:septal ring factor EnvC (AmiA/AmiB activator)
MSKERISASVDPEVEEYLSQDGVNASGLINRLVKNHASAGDREKAMLQLREDQLESEIESMRAQLKQKEDELSDIRQRIDEMQPEADRVVQEAVEEFGESL